ncbi:MAG: membrane protein [Lentimonas sp.]|jgi:membrane protein
MSLATKMARKKKFVLKPFYILKSSIRDTIKHDGVEHAGYLAFLSILALFPFLIFLFSIITRFSNLEGYSDLLYIFLNNLPDNISSSLLPRINEIVNGPPQSLLTIAFIGVIWTASSAVEGLRTILNRAYRAPSPPPYILGRMRSILQFIIITLVIAGTITVFLFIPAILKRTEILFEISFDINYDWLYFRQLSIVFILFITTSLLYYHITDVKQRLIDTFPGTTLVIIAWAMTLKIFIIYLENFNQFNFLYGGLGGIIGALMFFYFISLIFIIGAEFNYHFRKAYKRKLPKTNNSKK